VGRALTGGSPAHFAEAGGAGAFACQHVFSRLLLLLVMAGTLAAQSIDIYSELSRVDPFGEISTGDRAAHGAKSSPAVARNAWASFHVVILSPAQTTYLLYVVTNPLNACRVAAVQRTISRRRWRDGCRPAHRTDAAARFRRDTRSGRCVDGQTTRAYLLDL